MRHTTFVVAFLLLSGRPLMLAQKLETLNISPTKSPAIPHKTAKRTAITVLATPIAIDGIAAPLLVTTLVATPFVEPRQVSNDLGNGADGELINRPAPKITVTELVSGIAQPDITTTHSVTASVSVTTQSTTQSIFKPITQSNFTSAEPLPNSCESYLRAGVTYQLVLSGDMYGASVRLGVYIQSATTILSVIFLANGAEHSRSPLLPMVLTLSVAFMIEAKKGSFMALEFPIFLSLVTIPSSPAIFHSAGMSYTLQVQVPTSY
ncbi:hypothetical protein K440DRAFT_667518 [Wilcoxina mikolae CBS 423.85]|nr:hypothetical protein K440DRAFT_667518 [Wilcoxina mikolae CBS 423.85]